MKLLHMLTFVLVIVGALNWGLVGVGSFLGMNLNLVNLLVGTWPMLENVVYLLVGVSAVMLALGHGKDCSTCKA